MKPASEIAEETRRKAQEAAARICDTNGMAKQHVIVDAIAEAIESGRAVCDALAGCASHWADRCDALAAKCRAMEAVVEAARKETNYRGGYYVSPALCIAIANYDALAAADPEKEKG